MPTCTEWNVKPGGRKEPVSTNPAFTLEFALLWILATKSCSNSCAACANFQGSSRYSQATECATTWLLRMNEYLEELCAHHISGQLRIAPEHFSKRVTNAMCKPGRETYEKFAGKFAALNRKCGKEQYIVNYLMSGHPGCTLEDMIEMAEYVRDHGGYTEQVQDFTPTPMTVVDLHVLYRA